jgi:large subunit ribosomal protein L24
MTATKFKIKKGDQVVVTTGSSKGKSGTVERIIKTTSKVIVSNVNVVKKHQKPSQFAAGGIIEKSMPIHISNVALIDPKSGKPTKAGYKVSDDGNKTRIARKSGEAV